MDTKKGSMPLKNKKHELFCINLLTMKPSEAYIGAGYQSKGEVSMRNASRLLNTNEYVSARYKYLLDKHNKELEENGYISREIMLKKGLKALNISLGEEKITKSKIRIDKDGDLYSDDVRIYDSNMSAVSGIWDKLMNAMDYYPKEDNSELTIKDLIQLIRTLKDEDLKELLNGLS